jgi:hypothetical protein
VALSVRHGVTFRQAAGVLLSIALVQAALQLSLLARGVEYLAVSLTVDDTFYYLQTSWNTKQLGFVTFDGLHSTNGVQLLWFAIILLLTWLAKTKTALLVATLAFSFLLNALCYVVILRIGAVVKRPELALIMAGLWSLQSLPFRIYTMGMENSLHAFIFWCVIWQSLTFLIRARDKASPNFWGLTISLVLNAWTRFDSALLSAILYLFCMLALANGYRPDIRSFWRRHGTAIVGSSLLAGIGLVAQLVAFRLMGNSFLPVSAIVKTSGANRGLNPESVQKLIQVFELGLPSILQGRLPTLGLILLAAAAILLVIWIQFTRYYGADRLWALLNLWSCLALGELVYYVTISVSGAEYTPYFVWYRSPSFIFWVITGSLIALLAFEHRTWDKLPWRVSQWAPAGFGLLSFALAIYFFARSLNFTSQLYTARYQAAEWIAQNSPPNAIFASWNSGQLGYFSNRTFINLDGVINNLDYYQRVLHGPLPLANYLFENDVAYLVDYATYDSIPDFPVVRAFPINDGSGRSIRIWRVTPQAMSTP